MGCAASNAMVNGALTSKRGKTYDAKLDPQVQALYGRIGSPLLKKTCWEFYRSVGADDEMPSFREAFSTPAERASELLYLFFREAWGGPKEYTALRQTCWPFIRSIHRLWSFQLTEQNWVRWFYHWKKAMVTFEWPEGDQEVAMYSLYRMREWMDPEEAEYKKMFKDPGEFDAPAAGANKAADDKEDKEKDAKADKSHEKHEDKNAHNAEQDAKKYKVEGEKNK